MAKYIIWGLIALLVIVHQDFWFWENDTLVFGFLPMGLFYHACLSLAATGCWFLAARIAWPDELIEHVMEEAPSKSASDSD